MSINDLCATVVVFSSFSTVTLAWRKQNVRLLIFSFCLQLRYQVLLSPLWHFYSVTNILSPKPSIFHLWIFNEKFQNSVAYFISTYCSFVVGGRRVSLTGIFFCLLLLFLGCQFSKFNNDISYSWCFCKPLLIIMFLCFK